MVRLILSYAITLPLRDLHRRLQIPLAGLPESLQSKAGCVCVFFNEFMFNFIILITHVWIYDDLLQVSYPIIYCIIVMFA